MIKKLLSVTALSLALMPAVAQQDYDSDFGTWLELGAKKNLGVSRFSVGANAELRMDDNSRSVNRLSVGVDATYKWNKYVKFTLGYVFLDNYKKDKWKDGTEDNVWDKRKRVTDDDWKNHHRFYFDISPDIKVGRLLRISLRERYQYTFTPVDRYMRSSYYYRDVDGNLTLMEGRTKHEMMSDAREHKHVLRSRLKFEIDKKGLKWSPYVSVEAHNNLQSKMHLRKLRTALGTDYKLNRHHSVGAAYILTRENEDGDKELLHALDLNYSYKF
ncbi:MAG: DUF2490 domain-containing protein [Bacteroidaceae bacterium]|nr:DUF2490 domain-containing protein [Prevotellaceae bacterium]MDY5631543.1 DUF2490 domain-containing protein [Bacteroidaceae bacterium]